MIPTPKDCKEALRGLRKLHGPAGDIVVVKKEDENTVPVLQSLWRTMLSQNTTDKNSHRAYASFCETFADGDGIVSDWQVVLDAPDEDVERTVRCAGLSQRRVANLKGILSRLLDERNGELSLDYLRDLPSDEVKRVLTSYKGVGEKTASCVLLFNMRRPDFPVDVHVWRIARETLGWCPMKFSRDQVYRHLNRAVPDDIKLELHLLLVKHGKHCFKCAKNGKPQFESLGKCPLKRASKTCAIMPPSNAKLKTLKNANEKRGRCVVKEESVSLSAKKRRGRGVAKKVVQSLSAKKRRGRSALKEESASSS